MHKIPKYYYHLYCVKRWYVYLKSAMRSLLTIYDYGIMDLYLCEGRGANITVCILHPGGAAVGHIVD